MSKTKSRGKPRWELIPWPAVREVAKALTIGAEKHSPLGYQNEPHHAYIGATYRHLDAYMDPEQSDIDQDTGLHHLALAASDTLILLWQALNCRNGDKYGA